jgi:hypothetical protein
LEAWPSNPMYEREGLDSDFSDSQFPTPISL